MLRKAVVEGLVVVKTVVAVASEGAGVTVGVAAGGAADALVMMTRSGFLSPSLDAW